MLGDVYLTLAWLAVQRLRYGPLWPWEPRSRRRTASVLTLVRPADEDEERVETAAKRG